MPNIFKGDKLGYIKLEYHGAISLHQFIISLPV